MRSIDDHLHHVLRTIQPRGSVDVPLAQAMGRITRQSIISTVDLPPWPNSAMDGYAVKSSDLINASPEQPVSLPVSGDIPAGATSRQQLIPKTAMRIMTGAPIPEGCDAIIPLEKTLEWNEHNPTPDAPLLKEVSFTHAPGLTTHIRAQGEDISRGATVLESGVMLSPNRIAALAAVGSTTVRVALRTRVAVISTGTELVEIGKPLDFGQIYDSNSELLSALIQQQGGEVSLQEHVEDNAAALRECITRAQQCSDVIILTGGASVGAYDTTRLVLDHSLGTDGDNSELRRVEFTKVAMQPGKPQGFGQLDDGTYVWALPGNPVSVWVSFYMFVEPALNKLAGLENIQASWQPVLVSAGWGSPDGREQIMPITVTSENGKPVTVAPATVKGSGSHLAATLAHATGMARVPAEVTHISENDVVLMRGVHR